MPALNKVAETPGDPRCLYFFQVTWEGLFLVFAGVCFRDLFVAVDRLLDSIARPLEPLRETQRPVARFRTSDFLQLTILA